MNVKGEAAVLRATSDLRPDMSSEDEMKKFNLRIRRKL